MAKIDILLTYQLNDENVGQWKRVMCQEILSSPYGKIKQETKKSNRKSICSVFIVMKADSVQQKLYDPFSDKYMIF